MTGPGGTGLPGSSDPRQAAAAAVVESPRFQRAPNLARLLNYLVARGTAGDGRKITEYDIATEALERPADFDPATNSIVRVEIHRLRKRLEQYYANEGAGAPLRLWLPAGQYEPEFLPGTPADPEPEPAAAAPREPLPAAPPDPPRRRPPGWWPGAAALLVALLGAGLLATLRRDHPPPPAEPAAPAALPGAVRLLAGSPVAQTDRTGRLWAADAFFAGGESREQPQTVYGAADPVLFRYRREGRFRYEIPLPAGRYRLHLYFSETNFGPYGLASGGEGSRVFDVLLNGAPLLANLDILNEAGFSNAAVERIFDGVSPGREGRLRLDLQSVARGPAVLNAIAVIPAPTPGMPPVRIRCQPTAATDAEGRLWEPDRYVLGGQSVLRPEAPQDLYRGERYGHFSYAIPLLPGSYTVTLHFIETWFGRDGRAGPGRRRFAIDAPGETLARDLDVFTAAGGAGRPYTLVARGLRPDAHGRLVLRFSPILNYAMLSALEVRPEATPPP